MSVARAEALFRGSRGSSRLLAWECHTDLDSELPKLQGASTRRGDLRVVVLVRWRVDLELLGTVDVARGAPPGGRPVWFQGVEYGDLGAAPVLFQVPKRFLVYRVYPTDGFKGNAVAEFSALFEGPLLKFEARPFEFMIWMPEAAVRIVLEPTNTSVVICVGSGYYDHSRPIPSKNDSREGSEFRRV